MLGNLSSLPDLVYSRAQKYPDKTAYVTCMPNGMNGTLTFRQVDERSNALALYLRDTLGLDKGDRVAVQMPNCLSYPVAVFGVLKAGCVLVNTNPLYTPGEMLRQYRDAGVRVVISSDMFADKMARVLEELPVEQVLITRISDYFPRLVARVIRLIQKYWNKQIPPVTFENHRYLTSVLREHRAKGEEGKLEGYLAELSRDDVAALQYTGGTTGVSKGAVLTHGNLLANVAQILELMEDSIVEGEECVLTALPLYHIFAFTVNLLGFWCVGAKNVLIPNPRPLPNLKRAFENYPVTWLTGVNTLFNGLCNEFWFREYPPKRLKGCVAGGMALQSRVAERWFEVTGVEAVEGYGLTEASPVVTFNPIGGKVKPGTIGQALPETEVECVDEQGNVVAPETPGELWCRGPQVMRGYWHNEEETRNVLTEDGWLKTGDIAVRDEESFFRIVDRKKDMIVVSGFNVYPNEVEDWLVTHEKIAEAAVIGIPDETCGEVVKAFVVAADDSLTVEEVREYARKELVNYKVPKQVEFRSELPKSPVGKILRKELKPE